jgi:hypothetical protein
MCASGRQPLAVASAQFGQDGVAGLEAREEVSKIALDMREIHLIEQEEIRRLGVSGGPQHELERSRDGPDFGIGRGTQGIGVAEQVLRSGPVGTNGDRQIAWPATVVGAEPLA